MLLHDNVFIFVTNIESKDPSQIVFGNEKVIRPRLADAEFFFKTDKKQTLESRLSTLESVLFQKQLGTLKAKSERIADLSKVIAKQLGENSDDYSDENMQQVMASHHYHLQYLLYSVALHRLLKQRIPDYDINTHLGGVYYVFLRGMPSGKGIFYKKFISLI